MTANNEEIWFHNPPSAYFKYIDKRMASVLEEGNLSQKDHSLLDEYLGEISGDMCSERLYKYCYIISSWRDYIGPFNENTARDLFKGIELIRHSNSKRGKPFSSHTLSDYVKILKRFYFWLIENGYSDIPEKKIQKIKVPKLDSMTLTAEELLTEEEVNDMLEACTNSMDRAIISFAYEGGFRISEIGKLRWRQVKFNDWNLAVNVNNKTNKPRYIPLTMSRPYLAQWKNDYPGEPEGDNFVFLTLIMKKPFHYRGLKTKIIRIAERAKIEKKVTPHLFRHSRITHLMQKDYSDSFIKKMMWGNLTTNMFSVYAHLTDNDSDNELARREGIIVPEKNDSKCNLQARQCSVCYTINAPTMQFCSKCGKPLTEDGLAEREELKDILEKLPQETLIKLVNQALSN
ncbi:MAG: tyrosine-type recombinase/integrase [Methanomicrobium sp.]|jgi:Site-specific recombinase XerD|nr:tyrosine-type recombinase/integrase [Methanomicrobium sp.]